MLKFSIIVCTYNRSGYLRLNLEAIRKFKFPGDQYEVLVVDNNSTDDTKAVATSFQLRISNLKYIFESEQGLSHARNRGYKEARGEYVIYLDDDAIPYPNFMERVAWVEHTYDFDAWGGMDRPYFPEGRPHWLKDKYVTAAPTYQKVTLLKKRGEYFNGMIMVFKRSVLVDFGGFDIHYGMNGATIGYAEETELQVRMQKSGLSLGYDPDWKVKHCILPHKINISWFFDYSFAMGRYLANLYDIRYSFVSMAQQFLIGFFQMLILLVLKTPLLLFQKDYYIENWRIDVFRKFAKRLGMIYNGLVRDKCSPEMTQPVTFFTSPKAEAQ